MMIITRTNHRDWAEIALVHELCHTLRATHEEPANQYVMWGGTFNVNYPYYFVFHEDWQLYNDIDPGAYLG